jgi:hypothetical protein
VKVIDNNGVTGLYRSSEGKTGDAVWGTRAQCTMLTGEVDQEPIALVILDHPKNAGFPTYSVALVQRQTVIVDKLLK